MERERTNRAYAVMALTVVMTGCAIYIDHSREAIQIPHIDVDGSLDVAELELEKGVVLGLWALKDQVITPAQARRVSAMYFANVDSVIEGNARLMEFNVWHITWAIANLYRHGDEDVRAELEQAHDDALHRAQMLDLPVATLHTSGDRIYMGDFHGFAHQYAVNHVVAPGNPEYLQCFEQYIDPWKWCPGGYDQAQ